MRFEGTSSYVATDDLKVEIDRVEATLAAKQSSKSAAEAAFATRIVEAVPAAAAFPPARVWHARALRWAPGQHRAIREVCSCILMTAHFFFQYICKAIRHKIGRGNGNAIRIR